MSNPFADMEYISIYTRADAIADGVLVDVSDIAETCGYRMPVAMTGTVFATVRDEVGPQEVARVSALLLNLRAAIESVTEETDSVDFSNAGTDMYAVCGPGDTPEPCITIMLPHED